MTRCKSTYPGAVTLRGKPVRCDLAAGHLGEHGNSFAARYWPDGSGQWPACPFDGTTPDECATVRERSVAGLSNVIPPCPVHGAYSDGGAA